MTSFFAHPLTRSGAVLLGAAVLSAVATPSLAAAQCGPRDKVAQVLASDFNEKPVSMGLSASGALVVMFASPAGTWTAATVSAEGVACVVDTGRGWTDMTPPVGSVAQAQ